MHKIYELICSVLCRQTSLNDTPDEFLDPNPWPNASNESGTISLQKRAFTEDGSIMAILLCESGSEWRKVEFYNTESETAKKLDVNTLDKLKVPCSMAWTHDKKGLFYNVSLCRKKKSFRKDMI